MASPTNALWKGEQGEYEVHVLGQAEDVFNFNSTSDVLSGYQPVQREETETTTFHFSEIATAAKLRKSLGMYGVLKLPADVDGDVWCVNSIRRGYSRERPRRNDPLRGLELYRNYLHQVQKDRFFTLGHLVDTFNADLSEVDRRIAISKLSLKVLQDGDVHTEIDGDLCQRLNFIEGFKHDFLPDWSLRDVHDRPIPESYITDCRSTLTLEWTRITKRKSCLTRESLGFA